MYGPNRLGGDPCFGKSWSYIYGLCSLCWCVGGDFNVICFPFVKLGGGRLNANMMGFEDFI